MMAIDAGRRARRLEREFEALRPLGESYLLRRFAGQLGRADAEDAVAEVLVRLHRLVADGNPPDNLRAAFLTGVRNAAIDQLRSRAAKPTVALEAAMATPAAGAAPSEWAESREDAALLQDALARMRGRYREAILLRFGLGLSVPEIAAHLRISLPAAKKLVLRATRQVKDRYLAIEEAEFCPEMQELARRSLFEKEASGLASDAESEVLRAHFAHCGSCRSFVAALHEQLHDLGAAAVLGVLAAKSSGVRLGLLDRVGEWLGGAGHSAHVVAEKSRQLALRISGVASGGDGATAGALLGSSQKITAICTAGAATTCLLTGAVGIGVPPAHVERKPPAKTATLSREASPASPIAVSSFPAPPARVASAPEIGKPRQRTRPRQSRAVHTTASVSAEEFGLEGGPVNNGSASGETEAEASAPIAARPRAGSLGGSSDASTPSGSGSSSASGGGGGVGFEG